jgi:hypothetical protein
MIEITQTEQIAKQYAACMDSVNFINASKPEGMKDADWTDAMSRNKDHLVLMLSKNIFGGFDITPLEKASQ